MKVVTREEMNQILHQYDVGEYGRLLEDMAPGEALQISPIEFGRHYRTSVPNYFLGKFNRSRKTIRCIKFRGLYYVIKL